MKENIVELKNINFSNENYMVLENINLNIENDTFTCIIGRSGAGKSTLLKIMAGVLNCQCGIVKIFNKDIDKLENEEIYTLRKKIGFVFQDAALISNISIKENLMLPLQFHLKEMSKTEMQKRIIKILEKIELSDALEHRPAQLSLGERKLVGIARALITEPELLFLDDPIASIDSSLAKKVTMLIKEYSDLKNTTIVAVSTLKSLIKSQSDRIILIEDKSIALDITMDKLLKTKAEKRRKIINDFLS